MKTIPSNVVRTCAFLALLGTVSAAQDLVINSSATPFFNEFTAQDPFFPGPGVLRFPIPKAPLLPPAAFPFGDLTMNNNNGLIYETNGPLIVTYNHPAYPPMAPTFPPSPVPAALGPLTGIAISPTTGVLWVTTGAICAPLTPVPPFLPAGPAFVFGFPVMAPPMTGLDYDTATGTLWGCDAAGFVYNFTTAGLPLAVIPPPMPGIATDIALTRAPGPIPGIYVSFLAGTVLNYATGLLSPPMIGGGATSGLAFHADPNQLPSGCGCPGAFAGTTVSTTTPMTIGNAGFAWTLTGVPVGTPVTFGVDTAFLSTPLSIAGCSLYLSPGSSSLILFPSVVPGSGVATFPVSLAGIPFGFAGLTVYTQWAIACTTNPVGVVFSNAQQFVLSTP